MKNGVKALMSLSVAGMCFANVCLAGAADGPVVLDDCRSLEASKALWAADDATMDVVSGSGGNGPSGLMVKFGERGCINLRRRSKPLDWSRYKSLTFDVRNPRSVPVPATIRIDDAEARGFRDRYERCGTFILPPNKKIHVVQDLSNLLANNDRLMDSSEITFFGFSASDVTLCLDAFHLIPLPEKDRPVKETPAGASRVIDNFADIKKTEALWSFSNVRVEQSRGDARDGGVSLKMTFAGNAEYPGISLKGSNGEPMDWRGYRTFRFDVFNPGKKGMSLSVRIDGENSRSMDSRFNVDGIAVPAGREKNVKIDIWRMANTRGFRMYKAAIREVIIFLHKAAEDRVLLLSNVRLSPDGGGIRNEVASGRLPGMNPELLGKELLKDPEIKPLIPIFKAIPPRRVAICSHSVSISAHWSTSGGFFDIAAEAVKAVNPGFEYRGFHRGGMSASTAVNVFLKKMVQYRPADTYLIAVPDKVASVEKLIVDMKEAGSRVFVFDPVKAWGDWSKERKDGVRGLCKKHDAPFLELMERGYGAEGSQDWMVKDTCHMRTVGHMFYAKELLKEWGRIFGPVSAGAPEGKKTK